MINNIISLSTIETLSKYHACILYLNSIGIIQVHIILPEDFDKNTLIYRHKCEDGLCTIELGNHKNSSVNRLQFKISESMSIISIKASLPKISLIPPKQKILQVKYQVTKDIFKPEGIFDKFCNDSLFDIIGIDYHNPMYKLAWIKCKQCSDVICVLPNNSLIYKMNFSLEDNLELFLCHDKFNALHSNYLNLEKNLRHKVNFDERFAWIHQYLYDGSEKETMMINCKKCSMRLGYYDNQLNNDFCFRKYDLLKVSLGFMLNGQEIIVGNILSKAYLHQLIQKALIDNKNMIVFYTPLIIIELYIKINIIYAIDKSLSYIDKQKENNDNDSIKDEESKVKLFNIIEYTISNRTDNHNTLSKHHNHNGIEEIELIETDKDILLTLFSNNQQENYLDILTYKQITKSSSTNHQIYLMDL